MKDDDDWHAFKDLPPRKDPKGGSPKTPPGGVPYRDIPTPEAIFVSPPQANGQIWKSFAIVASSTIGIAAILVAVGIHIARFEALENRCVKSEEDIRSMNRDGTYFMRAQMEEDKKFHADVEVRLRNLERRAAMTLDGTDKK